MKKILAILLIVSLVFALAACGSSKKSSKATKDEDDHQNEPVMIVVLAVDPDHENSVTYADLDVVENVLEAHLGDYLEEEFTVTVDKSSRPRITMELNEELTDDEIAELISFDDKLTFRNEEGDILMDESYVESASVSVDTEYNYSVMLKFNEEGKELFAELTEEYMNQKIEVYLNDELLTAPTVQAPITDGTAQIYGDFTDDEALEIASAVNSSLLDFSLVVVKE